MTRLIGVLQDVQAILEAVVTIEARLATTAAIALVGIIALFVTPWVVARTSQFLSRRLIAQNQIPLDTEDVSWLLPRTVAIRTIQLVVVLVLSLALFLVWGYVDLAMTFAGWIATLFPTIGQVLLTLVLIFGAFIGTDVLEAWVNSYAEDSEEINQHQQVIVFRVLQVMLLIAVGLAVLTLWGFDLTGLLVGAGFLGIVLGMASRQTLGSLVAGFVLMFSRPFELGDWIEIEDHEGIVTDITIINTRIRNFDGETVVIPNEEVSGSTIVNRTDRDRLRLRVDVGVDYDTDVERAEEISLEAIESVDTVLDVPSPQVVPTAFGDSAIVLELRFWIDNPTARGRWRAKAAVVRAVKAAFEREGIKIPFPQRELMGRTEEDGFQVSGNYPTGIRPEHTASGADTSETSDGESADPDPPRGSD